MQELLALIHNRLHQTHKMISLRPEKASFARLYARFQVNEALRIERQTILLANHKDIEQPIENLQVCNQLTLILKQISVILQQSVFEIQSNLSRAPEISITLKYLSEKSKEATRCLRFKAAQNSQLCKNFHLSILKFTNDFGQLITSFAQTAGLGDYLCDQNDKNMKSLNQVLQESLKANTKVSNGCKKYAEEYKLYCQKSYKRRVKTLFVSSQHPKKLLNTQQKQVKNISPQKRNVIIANVLKSKQLQKIVKPPFPSAHKKIEFPQIYTAKPDPGPFLRGLRKHSTKKVMTLPNDQIYRPTYRLEADMCSTTKKQRLKNIIDPERQSAKLNANSNNERPHSRNERGKLQAAICFDDSFLKKGIDLRLLMSDKGCH